MRLFALSTLLACLIIGGCAAPAYQPPPANQAPPAQREPGGGSNGMGSM